MLKIGLTGGIGSGKSTVADYFAALGITVIDADVISHQLTSAGSPLTQQIAAHFGDAVIEKGELNRKVLRAIIFNDPNERKWLEQLLHPEIINRMLQQAQQARSPYCLLVIPLLIEAGLTDQVDRVLVVDLPEALQRQRAGARDQQTDEQIQAIIQSQSSREQKLAIADDVIRNDQSLADLQKQILTLHQQYLKIAGNY